MPESFSYRDAGVDIDREAEGIRALITALTYRRKGAFSMMGSVGQEYARYSLNKRKRINSE